MSAEAPSKSSEGGGVWVSSHPLLAHKLSILRDRSTTPKVFRELVREITVFLAYEALGDLQASFMNGCILESPIASYQGVRVRDRIALVPILRAGTGMLDGVLTMVPWAKVLHIGIFREKVTLAPIEYYNKLPPEPNVDLCIALDPMIATWGAKKIKVISICASKDGLRRLREAHPDIEIYTACVDDELTEHGYVNPGLGDAGDRLFNSA
ncbi:uracil phosphoribosyltransferase [Hyaloraphidium curvatum]|nr:uracil phosphoribosyltransferase [Hyaloraphidium curvatum]